MVYPARQALAGLSYKQQHQQPRWWGEMRRTRWRIYDAAGIACVIGYTTPWSNKQVNVRDSNFHKTLLQEHSGMARAVNGSRSFIYAPTHLSTNGMNHTCFRPRSKASWKPNWLNNPAEFNRTVRACDALSTLWRITTPLHYNSAASAFLPDAGPKEPKWQSITCRVGRSAVTQLPRHTIHIVAIPAVSQCPSRDEWMRCCKRLILTDDACSGPRLLMPWLPRSQFRVSRSRLDVSL